MAQLKTQKNNASVADYLNSIQDDQVRQDCWTILEMMEDATRTKGCMWGPSIVGFGDLHYQYASGREADWMQVGFSARKQNITLYLMENFEHHQDILQRLGKFKHAKSCLYIKKLSDINLPALKELIWVSLKDMINFQPNAPI